MERCVAMNKENIRIMAVIVLVVYTVGLCNTQASAAAKINYQKKSVIASPKKSSSKVASNAAGNTPDYNQSRRTVGFSALTFNTTFREAIDILRNSTTPPLKIIVLWRDLSENAYVEPDTLIKIDGASGIRLRTALELLLMAVYSGFDRLGYVVKDGVIIIATKDSLPGKMFTRVYNISDLTAATAGLSMGRGWQGTAFAGRGWPMTSGTGINSSNYNRRRQVRSGRRTASVRLP